MTTPTPGVPVGAVLLNPKHFQPLRLTLEKNFGKIRFRGVERLADGRLLVHVPPSVAAALDRGELAIPVEATYQSGVRQTLSLPPPQSAEDSTFTFVELFAGIGGFRLGLEKIGGKCVLASEVCPKATKIYESYFSSDVLVEGDVLDLDLRNFPSCNMLTGGFPCQPFSNRGHQRGFEDGERGQMYLELVRILKESQPTCFLFENVSQLVLMDGGSRGERIKGRVGTFAMGRVLKHMIECFESCGYQVDWKVINSRHFTPQNRERVYIVGTRFDLQCPSFDWDKVMPVKSCTTTVRDILEPNDSPAVLASELSETQWNKVLSIREENDLFMTLDNKAPTLISQYHRVGSLSSKFVSTKRGGRFLTPRECCRIMGFPEYFPCDAPHFYGGIGNAVTPPVIAAIGRELIRCVQTNGKEDDKFGSIDCRI